MTMTTQNMSIIQGDHYKAHFSADDYDPRETLDIYWICGDIEKTKTDMQLTENEITFHIRSSETEDMNGSYKHELKIVDDSNNVSTVAKGTANFGDTEKVIVSE